MGGRCQCTPQCNKPCGADGCGNQCPSSCLSLGQMCGPNDTCVECTGTGENIACSYLATNECVLGVCSPGKCTSHNASSTKACSDRNGNASTCSAGSCKEACVKDCSNKCMGGGDGCGGVCMNDCRSPLVCSNGTCMQRSTFKYNTSCSGPAYSSCTDANGMGGVCHATGYCAPTCDSQHPMCPPADGTKVEPTCDILCQIHCQNNGDCPSGMMCLSAQGGICGFHSST
jgi:hypothetical protein